MSVPERPIDALAGNAVLARANALMQRRRPQNEDVPVLTEAVPDSDLPVLTAVVTEEEAAAPIASAPLPRLDPAVFDRMAQELTRRVHDRLAAELPSLVEAALNSILTDLTRELESGLTETTEAAIRDFLDEHKKQAPR